MENLETTEKSEKGRKRPVVSLPSDAPSTLLTSSCHFPFATEVWNRILGDPGILPSCVCVCVLPTGSLRFHPPIRSSCGADPQHRVCLLWVLLIHLHKDWPAHRWRVSTTHLIPGCTTRAQAFNGVVLALGNRPMAENTDLGTRLVGLLTKWTWHPIEGRYRGVFNMWLNGTLRWESESGSAPQCRHNQRRMTTGYMGKVEHKSVKIQLPLSINPPAWAWVR